MSPQPSAEIDDLDHEAIDLAMEFEQALVDRLVDLPDPVESADLFDYEPE